MPAKSGPQIITSGLVCYIDIANPACYTGGSTLFDLSGNGKDFINDGATYTSDYGGGMQITAGSGRLYHADTIFGSTYEVPTTIFLIATSGNCTFVEDNTDGSTRNYFIMSNTNVSMDQYLPGGSGSRIDYSFDETTDGPRIAAQSTDASRYARWMVNGDSIYAGTQEDYSGALPDFSSINSRRLASNNYHNSYTGTFNALLCYNRALSEDEMIYNYRELRSRFKLK